MQAEAQKKAETKPAEAQKKPETKPAPEGAPKDGGSAAAAPVPAGAPAPGR
jgi:hypothetical protein